MHSEMVKMLIDLHICKSQFKYLVFLLIKKLNQLIYKVVLVSDIQESNSAIYIYILFHILFHYMLLQSIKYSSLCYSVGHHCSFYIW